MATVNDPLSLVYILYWPNNRVNDHYLLYILDLYFPIRNKFKKTFILLIEQRNLKFYWMIDLFFISFFFNCFASSIIEWFYVGFRVNGFGTPYEMMINVLVNGILLF